MNYRHANEKNNSLALRGPATMCTRNWNSTVMFSEEARTCMHYGPIGSSDKTAPILELSQRRAVRGERVRPRRPECCWSGPRCGTEGLTF